MTARNIGLLLWLLVGAGAAAAVYWQLAHPPRPPATSAASRPLELPSVEPTQLFQLPPLDQYGEIVLHPLFIAARQPEPPPRMKRRRKNRLLPRSGAETDAARCDDYV